MEVRKRFKFVLPLSVYFENGVQGNVEVRQLFFQLGNVLKVCQQTACHGLMANDKHIVLRAGKEIEKASIVPRK